MLTPNFELDQTNEYLILKIKARFANINDTEIDVDGTQVTFYSSPYYLRLNLPGEVAETDSSSGFYDWDTSIFTFQLNKVNPGEHFPDLNLINKFLAPKKTSQTIKPSIEVLKENVQNDKKEDDDDDNNDGNEDIDCNFLQKPILDKNIISVKYGFGNQSQDGFNHFNREFIEIIEIYGLDSMNFEQRKSSQAGTEFLDFCEDHYLADLMTEPDGFKDVLNFKPFWYNTTSFTLNDSQKNILKSFGNKEYLLSKDDIKSTLLSLVDIVYAYCFCIRTNLGEENTESAWLINKLSSTLSWLRIFETFNETVIACIRRGVCYPLYRRWDLSILVLSDVRKVFENGCVCLLTCLLDIHELFNSSEPRYVLNQLYIKDYCIWIQQLKSTHFETIVKLFDENKIAKKQVGFDLEVLEVAAMSVKEDVASLERAEKSNSIVSKLQKLQISSESSLDSDDDEEESAD